VGGQEDNKNGVGGRGEEGLEEEEEGGVGGRERERMGRVNRREREGQQEEGESKGVKIAL